MQYNYNQLLELLKTNVLYVSFERRNKKQGKSMIRRMICTNSVNILKSVDGQMVLNYREPFNFPVLNPMAYNLIVTWDVLMQDFRMIPTDSINVEQSIPEAEFFEHFKTEIWPMS